MDPLQDLGPFALRHEDVPISLAVRAERGLAEQHDPALVVVARVAGVPLDRLARDAGQAFAPVELGAAQVLIQALEESP